MLVELMFDENFKTGLSVVIVAAYVIFSYWV